MKNKRKNISIRLRFEILKRDKFTCQYCGANPPNVTLEIDHIKPVYLGGDNVPENLITSCSDCNKGKSKNPLTETILKVEQKIVLLKEKRKQYKEYIKLMKEFGDNKDSELDLIESIYISYFPDYYLLDSFKLNSIRNFIDKLDIITVKDAMRIACSTVPHDSQSLKYFCGICHNKIRQKYQIQQP